MLTLGAASSAHAQSIEVTDLGSLGGSKVAAYGINDAGLIVGASLDGRPEKVAFIKPPADRMFGLLGELGTRNAYSEARDVNARGDVLLFHSFRSSRVTYSLFVWTAARGLDVIGDGPASPVGIDDRGRVSVNGLIAQTAQRRSFESRRTAMVMELPTDVVTTLPELYAGASRGTRARGLNGRGDLVGYAPDARDVDLPVLWDADSWTLHVLPTPAGRDGLPVAGSARAINGQGTIVGEVKLPRATRADGTPCDAAPENADACTTTHAVAWRGPEHTLIDLGPGEVAAINDHDVVVGDRLWDLRRDTQVSWPTSDLGRIVFAHDINNQDVAVGEAGDRAVQLRYVP